MILSLNKDVIFTKVAKVLLQLWDQSFLKYCLTLDTGNHTPGRYC